MKPYIEHEVELRKWLKDPAHAASYLDECLKDDDKRVFLLAVRQVADAQGGMVRLARLTKRNRESLYKTLSRNGNPEFNGIDAVLDAMGFRLAIQRKVFPSTKTQRTR